MPRLRIVLAALLAVALALSPGLADARAGSGRSFGSRGNFTYSVPRATRTAPYGAAPMERSLTPRTYAPAPMYGRQGSSGFGRGFLGGMLGAGLIGLMFGHGLLGHGMGMFGLFGMLLQIVLIVFLVRWLFRLLSGGGGGSLSGYGGGAAMAGSRSVGGAGIDGTTGVSITPADYQQFEQLLISIQAAWSTHDINGLQAMATPEMVGYFSEQLSDQVSRGVRNVVSDVRLVEGDLAQAWSEAGRDYATVAMRFSMVDVTREQSGRVVDGSPTEHVTATEIWTFTRAQGGHWILSAIQQAR